MTRAVFSKNRERLLTSDGAQQFFAAATTQTKRFMSDDHFTVDGTLIGAWASQKSFRKKDGIGDGATNSSAASDPIRPKNRPPIRMRGSTVRATARTPG